MNNTSSTGKEPSIETLRHIIGSVSLQDVQEEPEMTENERQEYNAAISAVFPRLEKDLRRLQYLQLMFMARHAGDWDAILIARGTMNAYDLMLEKWREAHMAHEERSQPKEKFNKHEPISSI